MTSFYFTTNTHPFVFQVHANSGKEADGIIYSHLKGMIHPNSQPEIKQVYLYQVNKEEQPNDNP